MLKVELIDDYIIEVDEAGKTYNLYKVSETENKKGELVERKRLIGYMSSIEQCILKCVREKIAQDNIDGNLTLKEYLTQFELLKNEIKELLGGI